MQPYTITRNEEGLFIHVAPVVADGTMRQIISYFQESFSESFSESAEREEMLAFSQQRLSEAYSDDEPDYSDSIIELNPLYRHC